METVDEDEHFKRFNEYLMKKMKEYRKNSLEWSESNQLEQIGENVSNKKLLNAIFETKNNWSDQFRRSKCLFYECVEQNAGSIKRECSKNIGNHCEYIILYRKMQKKSKKRAEKYFQKQNTWRTLTQANCLKRLE